MAVSDTLLRSVLYIPGSNGRALEKATSLDCDAIIFDLEDAVAPGEKAAARAALALALSDSRYSPRTTLVRVNSLDSQWGSADLEATAAMACDAVLVPKVEETAQIDAVARHTGPLPIWCMIETPAGVLNAATLARHEKVAGFVIGTNDLAKEIGCGDGTGRMPLMASLQIVLLGARAGGVACIDGVYNAFRDETGLEAECKEGRDLGMDGKSLIHPSQIEIANRVFAPAPEAVELARRQISTFEEAEERGEGVAVLDGRIVENLHVETARSILAREKAIRERHAP